MAAKRIIMLLDGTWNDADLSASDTNIVRMREIIARSLDVKSALDASCWKMITPDWAGASQHEARKGIYKLMRRAIRSIANHRVPIKSWQYEREVSRNRHDETMGEMIHASVIERLGQPIGGKPWRRKYEPRNLLGLLDAVKNTYGMSEEKAENNIRIVGWDGRPLEPLG